MAILWHQLPPNSRTAIAEMPDNAWATSDFLLRQIEFHLQRIVYMFNDQKKNRLSQPKPILSPGQINEAERKREAAKEAKKELDKLLKIDGLEVKNG